ncbi:MAG: hypothetical protein IH877_02595 [Gemmatimonadetes bacterium]|nr:hypothetical protein [Gemmatimonadota bacterium]
MKPGIISAGSLFGSATAALTGGAASICCIGPLALTLLGVQGAIWAAGLQPYRWYLLGTALVFLAIGFWSQYGARFRGKSCSLRSRRIGRITLWTSASIWMISFILQFVAKRYWL